ncbi:hypothetical protein [Streptomyces sp. CB02923]|uniref:hypothetical protein n=1 Tax=Streptomyces sp. CB02923 TaxID=1718985 RepID=UPI001F5BE3FC|nr:hypothetical protein [Streptomyces sp. CB02923]
MPGATVMCDRPGSSPGICPVGDHAMPGVLTTCVNAAMAPAETATGDGDPPAVNGTTVPTSRSSMMSVGLPTVPRTATANWFELSRLRAMYTRFALSGLSASHTGCQVLPVSVA